LGGSHPAPHLTEVCYAPLFPSPTASSAYKPCFKAQSHETCESHSCLRDLSSAAPIFNMSDHTRAARNVPDTALR
jgi:hypothetical protein